MSPCLVWRRLVCAALCLGVVLAHALLPGLAPRHAEAAAPVPHSRLANLAQLPLSFVPNRGQTAASVQFQAHSQGGTLFFTPSEVVLSLPAAESTEDGLAASGTAPRRTQATTQVVRLRFEGANATPNITGAARLAGIVNYLVGNDPAQWRTQLPTYAGITYEELYPGIDLHYDGTQQALKGTYQLAPGADPTRIRWRYEGATSVQVDETSGDLHIDLTGAGATLVEQAPVAWQTIAGRRVAVAVRYALAADGSAGFVLGEYDRMHRLTLDPTLAYSTYLGGDASDSGNDIAVDSAGQAYVTGHTESSDFPTANALDNTLNGEDDIFVAKLAADGSALLYSTFLGGSRNDAGFGIAVDSAGQAYATGYTFSPDFPTANALDNTFNGGIRDGIVVKLVADGSALLYSTYLGGSDFDSGRAVAVDSAGHAYITGQTDSADFPTVNPLDDTLGGFSFIYDVFVSKLAADGSALLYSTYLGGSATDGGVGIAVDSAGNAYVTGETFSADFPTANALDGTFGGVQDAFVAKLAADGSALLYSTYLGGSGREFGGAVAVDSTGNAYVTGQTDSADFPTVNALDDTFNGQHSDGFVAKLAVDGGALLYSTFLGSGEVSSGGDGGRGIAVDNVGHAYVTGVAYSADFPLVNPLDDTFAGHEAFVAKLSEDATATTIVAFDATAQGPQIVLSWLTASERESEGFHVWRSTEGGEYIQLNDTLIIATGGADRGASYEYVDADVIEGVIYFYKLEEVDSHGANTFHGPISTAQEHRLFVPLIAGQ